jgi:Protein of unknown function (DUF4054)
VILADFRTQFPEFRGVNDSVVTAMLGAAFLEIDVCVWGGYSTVTGTPGTKADQGQAYLTAHKLATSPFGQNAKLVAKDGSTTYFKTYMTLVRQVSSGFRVAR